MQVYSVLRILTARPDETELAAVPHFLYGHVHPGRGYSTGAWLRDVEALLESGVLSDRTPIFTGGTGLYFRALLGGLSDMPPIPQSVRNRWRGELARMGASALHRVLEEQDPDAAAATRPSDGQRILRALEIRETTGRSVTVLRTGGGRPLVDAGTAELYVIEPDRALLHARINERFDTMIESGALEEVRALAALHIDPTLPAMKAIGVRELRAALAGELSVGEAIEKAKAATRQYAKRQSTWFRRQVGPEWKRISLPAGEGDISP